MLLVGELALAPGLVRSGSINASCAALQCCALIMGHDTCSSRIASSSPSSSLSTPQRVPPLPTHSLSVVGSRQRLITIDFGVPHGP